MLTPYDIDLKKEVSEVLFITGLLCKETSSEDDVHHFLSSSEQPYTEIEIDAGSPGGGKLWVRYPCIEDAIKAQPIFHQQSFDGRAVMCRFELAFDPTTGKRRVSRNSIHTTCIRRIQERRGQMVSKKKEVPPTRNPPPVNYSHKSLFVGNTEYPFPSGLYLARVVSLLQRWPNRRVDPIIQLVSNTYLPNCGKTRQRKNSTFGNSYAKEISESMAMVDALERAMKLCIGRTPGSFVNSENCCVRVYCLGDGKYPMTAGTMSLNFPHPGWEFISIDPILEPIPISSSGDRCHQLEQFVGMSEDYRIPMPPQIISSGHVDDVQYVDIVVACHSHAPLQEFWDRLLNQNARMRQCQAIAIAMPCCANFSHLKEEPMLTFQDFEVYSPKREIKIYSTSK